jgi:hypothetical protein
VTLLDALIPSPRLIEVDEVDLAAPAAEVWKRVRFDALPQSPVVRALFAVRTLAERGESHDVEPGVVRLSQLVSTPERPGFRILAELPAEEVAVGAIGKVWQPKIPFVHLDSAEDFAPFGEPGYVKVAWSLRVEPRGERDSRLTLELRVDATDETSWRHFRRYFLVIGPAVAG